MGSPLSARMPLTFSPCAKKIPGSVHLRVLGLRAASCRRAAGMIPAPHYARVKQACPAGEVLTSRLPMGFGRRDRFRERPKGSRRSAPDGTPDRARRSAATPPAPPRPAAVRGQPALVEGDELAPRVLRREPPQVRRRPLRTVRPRRPLHERQAHLRAQVAGPQVERRARRRSAAIGPRSSCCSRDPSSTQLVGGATRQDAVAQPHRRLARVEPARSAGIGVSITQRQGRQALGRGDVPGPGRAGVGDLADGGRLRPRRALPSPPGRRMRRPTRWRRRSTTTQTPRTTRTGRNRGDRAAGTAVDVRGRRGPRQRPASPRGGTVVRGGS